MLTVGDKFPQFSSHANVGPDAKSLAKIDNNTYSGKWVTYFFYPKDFTFVCPTEITAFSDRYADFSSKNTEVLGVSVDSQFSHLSWIQTARNEGGLGDIAYPLVADLKKKSQPLTTFWMTQKALLCAASSSSIPMV